MAVAYTRKMFIQRVERHIADGYPSDEFTASTNEIMLYIDQAIATVIVGQSYAGAKIEGSLVMPEAYLITYELEQLLQDVNTQYWYSILPQPPLSLPLGYSVTDVYPVQAGKGRGESFLPIKNKRVSYRKNMPMPFARRYWIENSKIWFAASDGSGFLNTKIYVQMPSARTTDINEVMNIPDDALEAIFTNVTNKLIQRYQMPKDVVADDIGAGNKTS